MTWGKKKILGVEYDLTHLDPLILHVTPKKDGAPTFKVRVSFGSHTFTREWRETDTPDYEIKNGSDIRCFCPIRHNNSLNLPLIMRGAATGKAYFSRDRNYLLIHDLAHLSGPYAVFFNLEKARSKEYDAALFVVSAYEKPNLPKKLPAITFATLISKTVGGQPIIRPKK